MFRELEVHQNSLINIKNELQYVKNHCQEMQQRYELLQEKCNIITRVMLENHKDRQIELNTFLVTDENLSRSIELQTDPSHAYEETTSKDSGSCQACSRTKYRTRIERNYMVDTSTDILLGKIFDT